MMERVDGKRLGELARDAGIARAASGRQVRLMRDELAFIDSLFRLPDGATTDDSVTDLALPFADGGRWRGSIPMGLARDGLIHRIGWVASCRLSRHRGPVSLWAVANRDALEHRATTLRAILTALDTLEKDAGESVAADPPAVNNSTDNPEQNGDSNHGPSD